MSASARLLREKKPVNYKPAPLNRSLTVKGDTVTVDIQETKPEVSPNHRDKVVTEDGRVFFPCPYCSRAFTDKVNRAIHLNTCPAKSYILSVASAGRTDDLLGPKTERETFIAKSEVFDKTPSFSEEEQRAFMQAVQLAKVNEIISDDDGKTVITRMTYNKRALQKAKLVAALSATLDSNSDNKPASANGIPKTPEHDSNPETKLPSVKLEVKKTPSGSKASEKNSLKSANKKPVTKKGATNVKKVPNQQKAKLVPTKAVPKKAAPASASKKAANSLPSQKSKVAPKKVAKKKVSPKPVVKVKLKKTLVPKKVVKKVTTNKPSKPKSPSKVSKKVAVAKSATKTNASSTKATPSKTSKNNMATKPIKITKGKVQTSGKSNLKKSNTKIVKPNKTPQPKKTISKQIVIAPSIGMAALEKKISDLVKLMSGGNESKSPKLTLKKDAKTGSLVITSEVVPTENKTPTKRTAQESDAAPKGKKVKLELATDAGDADSSVTNAQIVPEVQEKLKLKAPSKVEVCVAEAEVKVKAEESEIPVNKKASNKLKKSTNNAVSKPVKKPEKTKGKTEPVTQQNNVSPKKKSSLPKIVLKTNTSRKTNTRNNKMNTSAKTKNNTNIRQARNLQSRKPVLTANEKKDDKPKGGKVIKPNLKTLDQRKLKNQVNKMTEENAKDTSLPKEATSNLKLPTLTETLVSMVEVTSKQTQKLPQSKLQKTKMVPDKVDKLLVLDITGTEDDTENDGYKHATENIKIPVIESYSSFSVSSAKAKNASPRNRAQLENVQKSTRLTRTASTLKLLPQNLLNTPSTPKQPTSEGGKGGKLKIDEQVIKIDDDIIDLDDEVIEVDEELPENKNVLEAAKTPTKPLTDEELLSLLTLRDDVQVECIIQKPVMHGRSSLPSKSAAFPPIKSVVSTRNIRSNPPTPSTLKNVAKTADNIASTSKIDRTSLIQELILNNIPKDDMHPKKLESYFRQLAMNLAASNAKELSAGTTRSTETQTVTQQNKNEDDSRSSDVVAVCSDEPTVVNVDGDGDGVEMDPLLLEEEEDEATNRGSEQASSGSKSDTTCKYCLQVFDTAIECLRHKRQMHMFPKILLSTTKLQEYMNTTDYSQCPICHRPIKLHPGLTSRNRNAYQKHLRTHSKDTNYSCSKCHKKFKREDYMKIHEKRHY